MAHGEKKTGELHRDESEVVNLTVNRSGLAPGIHKSTLIITSKTGDRKTFNISVDVPKSTLKVDREFLDLAPTVDGLTLEISREGFSTIDWEIKADQDWLSVDPNSGKLSDEEITIEVNIDRSKFVNHGEFPGTLTLKSDQAENSPTVQIMVEVLPTFRLIILDALKETPIANARLLGKISNAEGVIEWQNVSKTELSGKIKIEGWIDRDFSKRFNDGTTDRIIEETIYLMPIPKVKYSIGGFEDPTEIILSDKEDFAYVVDKYTIREIRTADDSLSDVFTLPENEGELLAVAADSDRNHIYATYDKISKEDFVYIISGNNESSVKVGSRPVAVAVDTKKDQLYVANSLSNNISVINLETQAVSVDFSLGDRPEALLLVEDRLYVATANRIAVLETTNNTEVKSIKGSIAGPVALVSSLNGDYIYVANNGSQSVSVIRRSDLSLVTKIKIEIKDESRSENNYVVFQQMAVSRGVGKGEEERIYLTNSGNMDVILITKPEAEKWNVAEETIRVGFMPKGIAVSLDGEKIYVVEKENSEVKILKF